MPKYVSTLSIYEPSVDGKFNTEPYEYRYESSERMSNEVFTNLIWQCVEIERISEGTTLAVDVQNTRNGIYVDGDEYEITLAKVVLTDKLTPFVDWEKCSPNLPRIYAIDKEKSKMEVNLI